MAEPTTGGAHVSFDDWRTWGLALIAFWNAGLTAVAWLRRPGEDASRAASAIKDAVAAEMQTVLTRLTQAETHIGHMPTRDELSGVEGTVKQIDERTKGLAEAITQIRQSQARVENFLLTSNRP